MFSAKVTQGLGWTDLVLASSTLQDVLVSGDCQMNQMTQIDVGWHAILQAGYFHNFPPFHPQQRGIFWEATVQSNELMIKDSWHLKMDESVCFDVLCSQQHWKDRFDYPVLEKLMWSSAFYPLVTFACWHLPVCCGRTNKDGWGRASLQVWHKSVRPMNRVHSTWHSQDLFWKLIPPKCWSIPKSKVGFWYGMHVWDVAFHACTHTYSMTHRSYSGCWYDVLPLLRDTDT